jgi:hypothetical protein
MNRLTASNPANGKWLVDALEIDCEEARLALARKDLPSAEAAMARARGRAEAATGKQKLNDVQLAKLHTASGDVETAFGREQEARVYWQKAVDALAGGQSARAQEMRAGGLLRLGQKAEAEPILKRLRSMGPLVEELEEVAGS